MRTKRGISGKISRLTAVALAFALVLSNVGAGMWNVYAEEPVSGESRQESETEPEVIQLTTAASEENETPEGQNEEPAGDNAADVPSGDNADEPSVVQLDGTSEDDETRAPGDFWADEIEENEDEILPVASVASPANAVEVTVKVEGEGIASTEPEAQEEPYSVERGKDFTIVVTPEQYYKASVTVDPEAAGQETRAKDGTYTYTISDLQDDVTVIVTAEYLEAVAAYYVVAEEVENFGDVTKENIEEARALYDKFYAAHIDAIDELKLKGTSQDQTTLDTNFVRDNNTFLTKIQDTWKDGADYDGWYLIITHQAEDDAEIVPEKEYVYLRKAIQGANSETLVATSPSLDEYKKDDFHGKKYVENSIKGISLGSVGKYIYSPAEVTFYYAATSGEGWEYIAETNTLVLTGDVTTTRETHPWKAYEKYIKKIYAPGTTQISIGENAFSENPYSNSMTGIKEIELNNIKKIGDGAFHACGALETVTLNDVEQIGNFARDTSADRSQGVFSGSKVKKVTLNNVTTIGAKSFYYCENITELTMSGVKEIGTGAFWTMLRKIKEITIPDTCEFIGANAFSVMRSALTSFVLPENENLILGYSSEFSNEKLSLREALIERMQTLMPHSFELSPITTMELPAPEGWTDSKTGKQNSTEPKSTQITKSARWADDAKTKAEIELQFSHSTTPGKDILFLLDYSNSVAYPATYKDSKLYNIQFKTIDLIEDLFEEGYENQVAVLTFGGTVAEAPGIKGSEGTVESMGFTTDKDGLIDFVSHGSSFNENTSYTLAFNNAKDLIEGRNDPDREVEIIFISDGVPYADRQPLPYEGDIKNAVDAVKALPNVEIFSVLQADNSTAEAEEIMMQNIASAPEYYFEAEDTESFNDAVNAAIAAAYGTFTVTDTVGADFDLDTASVVARSYDADGNATVLSDEMLSSVTFTKDADGNDVITWELPALANTRYTLTFTENLKPDDAGKYPAGELDTNTGDAEVWALGANEVSNTVATPKLSRAAYGITVHYLEKGTNETLAEDGKYTGSENEAYDISGLLNQQIEGYQLDGYQMVDGQVPQAQGTLTGDIEINVYYVKTPAPTEPEPTDPQPTNPEPTDPQPTEPEPTEPQPTEPNRPSGGTTPGPGPATDIPDNDTPLASVVEIENEAVPLSDGLGLVVIDDEEVPLFDAPQTGDNRPVGAMTLLALMALGMMGVLGSLGLRKKDAE